MNCFNNVGPAKYTYASLTAIMTYKKNISHSVCPAQYTDSCQYTTHRTLLTTGSSGGFFLTRKDFEIMFNH